MTGMSIYDEIAAERQRAHAKHGAKSMEGDASVTTRPRSEYLAHRDKDGHWLKIDGYDSFDGARIMGCHCGFMADPDDDGLGESVLDHFEDVVRAEIAAALGAQHRQQLIDGQPARRHPYAEGWDDAMEHAEQIARGEA